MIEGDPARDLDLPAFFHPLIFDVLDSTNDEAKRRARNCAPEGTLIVARRQTGGRGRRGRTWQSPEGNLYCSLVLRPACSLAQAAQLSFVAAVALAEALADWLPVERIALKWPNDVRVDGAKISGILLESEAGPDGRSGWIVIGIGINVGHCPAGLDQAATALRLAVGVPVTPESVLKSLAPALVAWYDRWTGQGFAPVRAAWLARAAVAAEPLRVRLPEGEIEGMFEGLDDEGALVLRLDDGTRRQIAAGEVYAPAG